MPELKLHSVELELASLKSHHEAVRRCARPSLYGRVGVWDVTVRPWATNRSEDFKHAHVEQTLSNSTADLSIRDYEGSGWSAKAFVHDELRWKLTPPRVDGVCLLQLWMTDERWEMGDGRWKMENGRREVEVSQRWTTAT